MNLLESRYTRDSPGDIRAPSPPEYDKGKKDGEAEYSLETLVARSDKNGLGTPLTFSAEPVSRFPEAIWKLYTPVLDNPGFYILHDHICSKKFAVS